MTSLFELAEELQTFFADRDWQYCFIGGIALQRWGQPRLTNDVDVTLLTGFGREQTFIDPLLEAYKGRLPETRAFALANRVLLLESKEGIPIDVALGGIPFEESVIARASQYEFLAGLSLLTCSAEDLVVLKTFADRSRDWADVESVLGRQQGNLNWGYVFEQLRPLCDLKDAPEILARLENLRRAL